MPFYIFLKTKYFKNTISAIEKHLKNQRKPGEILLNMPFKAMKQ
jgi:hypothetical protein